MLSSYPFFPTNVCAPVFIGRLRVRFPPDTSSYLAPLSGGHQAGLLRSVIDKKGCSVLACIRLKSKFVKKHMVLLTVCILQIPLVFDNSRLQNEEWYSSWLSSGVTNVVIYEKLQMDISVNQLTSMHDITFVNETNFVQHIEKLL